MVTASLRQCTASACPDGDDLSRDAYGLFGMVVDAADRTSTLEKIVEAVDSGRTFLLSTPNVNFLAECERDPAFRETVLQSDHCSADGMPIVWVSRLLDAPIKERVSGSDLFEALRAKQSSSRPLKVFLFGGSRGTAETVSNLLNARPSGIQCVGWLNPGFGSVEEMSDAKVIERINTSGADILAVFLSAKKAQFWLHHNHSRLRIPVRGQFGATINYQAGLVRRAPLIFQRLGFEWLWRIKEEPYLWRRYWTDGKLLARLLITRAVPIAFDIWWQRRTKNDGTEEISFWRRGGEGCVVAGLVGFATKMNVTKSIAFFRNLLVERCDITLDISEICAIDPRYFGLLLMLRKQLRKEGRILKFAGATERTKRTFRMNGFEFLLEPR